MGSHDLSAPKRELEPKGVSVSLPKSNGNSGPSGDRATGLNSKKRRLDELATAFEKKVKLSGVLDEELVGA